MVVIGLVGRIAAGKSTVARAFAARGAVVVDADRIAHAVLDEPAASAEVAARFGADVLDESGRVRRPALAERVFGPTAAHDAALRDLEAIVHPRVRKRIEARLEEVRAAGETPPASVVVLDVPLLMQAGLDSLCDRFVVVNCAEPTRQGRLDGRGWPPEQRAARERAWERGRRSTPPEKTLVVDASGDPAYTLAHVGGLYDAVVRD